jgi:uncharacterized protein with PQ loop repeat
MAVSSVSLQLSFVLYMFMLFPQILLNFSRHGLYGLSWGMHMILLISSICDLFYALSQKMPWQYYMVAVVSIGTLSTQHFQFWRYHRRNLPPFYRGSTVVLILFGLFATVLLRTHRESWLFSLYGYIAMGGYFSASVPQILINRRLRSTAGVALSFVLLLTGGLCCDIISAYSLNWGLPNKIGAPAALLLQFMLLRQFWMYRHRASG